MRRWLAVVVALGLPCADTAARQADAVDDLIAAKDPADRERAAELLGERGTAEAIGRLLPLLDDPDWGVQQAAIHALGPLADPRVPAALVRVLREGPCRRLRVAAAAECGAHHRAAASPLATQALQGVRGAARVALLDLLGFVGGEPVVAALSAALWDADADAREAAARALARAGAGEAALIAALGHPDERTQWSAAAAIAGVDSDRARAAVVHVLDRAPEHLVPYLVGRIGILGGRANRSALAYAVQERLAASGRVGRLLRLAAVAGLHECSVTAREHLGARDPITRGFAWRVSSLDGPPLGWELAGPACEHPDPRVRAAAARAHIASTRLDRDAAIRRVLAHRRAEVAMEGVRAAVEGRATTVVDALAAVATGQTDARDWQLQSAACVALGRVGERAAFPTLRRLLEQTAWWLRAAAYEGLSFTRLKDAIPLLIAAFDDPHPVVRRTVRANLRVLLGRRFASKAACLAWWREHGPRWQPPLSEAEAAERRRGGYATREYVKRHLDRTVAGGTDILCIKGSYDHVEDVLTALQVPHEALFPKEARERGVAPKEVVCLNCEGSVDSAMIEYLQWFVACGGYLASSDWALANGVVRAFPGVAHRGRHDTGNAIVTAEPAIPGHPLLADVFQDDVEPKWWLEVIAHPVVVDDPLRVTVLIDSFEMLRRWGEGALLVEFDHGLGRVLHTPSHFFYKPEGIIGPVDAAGRRRFAADHLGLPDRGRLQAGAWGDVVVLDRDLALQAVRVEGQEVLLN